MKIKMITSKQRAYLRSMSNTLETLIQIGKEGVTENVIEAVDTAYNTKELIKLKVFDAALISAKEVAINVAEKTNSDVVQVIGSRFVLYRAAVNAEKRKIILP